MWKLIVSFMLQQLYPPPLGESPQYALDRTLGGQQSQCGSDGEEMYPCQELNPGCSSHGLVAILTEVASVSLTEYFFFCAECFTYSVSACWFHKICLLRILLPHSPSPNCFTVHWCLTLYFGQYDLTFMSLIPN
jgi:hypothetical protein